MGPDSTGTDSIEEFAGDRAGGQVLRQSLGLLVERYGDQPLGQQAAAVLAGRMTMRELAGDPEFASMAIEGMRSAVAEWEAMSPEQRAAFAADSRRIEDEASE